MKARKSSFKKAVSKHWSSYFFVLPFIFLFGLFMIVPFCWLFVVSLYSGSIYSPMQKFVGIHNYLKVLSESVFWLVVKNTLAYVGIITVVDVILSICFALLCLSGKRSTFFKTALIFPFFCPIIVGGFMWRWMVHYDHGVINIILSSIGIQGENWLSGRYALFTVAGMEIWRAVGYYTLVVIAGMKSIPHFFYEAAMIDGANSWQKFRHINLPLLRPCLTFIVLMNCVWGFGVFASVWVITGGGPAHKSSSLTYYTFTRAFKFHQLDYASVSGFLLMFMSFVIAIVMVRILRSEFEF